MITHYRHPARLVNAGPGELEKRFRALVLSDRPSIGMRILPVVQFPEIASRLADTQLVDLGQVEIESGFELWGERPFLRDLGGTGIQDL